jgi:membrane carboxypeptidase/penicillin-binding protein
MTTQQCADKAFCDQCILLREELNPDVDGALLSIDTNFGEIRAMVGGFDFKTSKFNRAFGALSLFLLLILYNNNLI